MREEATPAALRAVLNGDTEAFRAILHDYGPRVERLVSAHSFLPHEIPEVATETIVRASQKPSAPTTARLLRTLAAP